MPSFIDLTGDTFFRLRVLCKAEHLPNNKNTRWLCLCDCGQELTVFGCDLKTGNTSSCGCYALQSSRALGLANKTHGQTGSEEYRAWVNMKDRCFNSGNASYQNYGARGIEVCEKWANSFEAFYEDMGPKPTSDHSIDRYPNNDGNYEPGNCRWATWTEQHSNKRNNVYYEYQGEKLTASALARKLGVPVNTTLSRLHRGMSFEEVVEKARLDKDE